MPLPIIRKSVLFSVITSLLSVIQNACSWQCESGMTFKIRKNMITSYKFISNQD